MTIDWAAFLLVFAAALAAAALAVGLFSLGIRIWAAPGPGARASSQPRDEEMDPAGGARSTAATVAGTAVFGLAGLVALTGLWLIVR